MHQSCNACRNGVEPPMRFSMAFQPIIDVNANKAFAYEALVRGPNGEGAGTVLGQVTEQNRYSFDQSCRVRAITLASQLGLAERHAKLSINFMPGAVYSPAACVQLTLATAREQNFPLHRLIFEFTENEQMDSPEHLQRIADEYRRHGFTLALDDFGAGFSNVNLLARLHTGIVKLDMDLTRDLHRRPRAQAIVRFLVRLCRSFGSEVIGEGVETYEEFRAIRRCGVRLMQGYLFAKPAFERLPDFEIPRLHRATVPILDLSPVLNLLPAVSGIVSRQR